MKPVYKTILLLAVFSIAMGLLESAVVVYLRALYYPSGFDFPLVPLDNIILVTELLREVATLVMLLYIAIVAGKNFAQRFAFFLFCFAIWDIFYYIFLKLLIGWPSSMFTWDILFLLPVPWIGPVLAPCLLSATMILFTFIITYLQENQRVVLFRWFDWLLLISACLIIIGSFTIDYLRIIFTVTQPQDSSQMIENFRQFIPERFNWTIFAVGEIVILADLALFFTRNRKS